MTMMTRELKKNSQFCPYKLVHACGQSKTRALPTHHKEGAHCAGHKSPDTIFRGRSLRRMAHDQAGFAGLCPLKTDPSTREKTLKKGLKQLCVLSSLLKCWKAEIKCLLAVASGHQLVACLLFSLRFSRPCLSKTEADSRRRERGETNREQNRTCMEIAVFGTAWTVTAYPCLVLSGNG